MKFDKVKINLIYEIFILILVIASLATIWIDNELFIYFDRIVWLILFIDVLVRFIFATKKWRFLKSNIFDIIAIIPLDAIFQTARFARLLRLVRLFLLTKNHVPILLKILKTNGLDKLIYTSFIMIFLSSLIVTYIEPNIETFSDGVWWSIVTTTTVGYGDISPSTMVGRVVAVVLMIVGIGLIGMLTSSITTFFIKENKVKIKSVSFIQDQLNNFEDLSEEDINEMITILHELKKRKSNDYVN
ncbi:potassium channel family protein [Paraliobacillus salinarum]|uniref:potassium channel family protein n=1 Tax=Paraliobacillus salinarum TaxID=1158996 RepID=UPI0015F48BB4|nr:potassium channel family protein [Paraliobacillus salinarum]